MGAALWSLVRAALSYVVPFEFKTTTRIGHAAWLVKTWMLWRGEATELVDRRETVIAPNDPIGRV